MAIVRPEEEILEDVKDYIKDGLNAHLVTIEDEAGDAVSLPDIRYHGVGEYAIDKLPDTPALLYYPEDVIYEYLTTKSEEITIAINGILVIHEANSAIVVKRLLRYVAGLRVLLDADRTASSAADHVRITEVRYFASIPGQEKRRMAEIIMTAKKEISR